MFQPPPRRAPCPVVVGGALVVLLRLGGWRDRTWPDDWTAVTADGSKSAQFEHTFLVTEDGYEILTMRDGEPRMAWDLAKQQR